MSYLSKFLTPTCLPGLLMPHPSSGLEAGSVWTKFTMETPAHLTASHQLFLISPAVIHHLIDPPENLREAYSLTSALELCLSWLPKKDLGPRIGKLENSWGTNAASLTLPCYMISSLALSAHLHIPFSLWEWAFSAPPLTWWSRACCSPGATEAPTFSNMTQLVSHCQKSQGETPINHG